MTLFLCGDVMSGRGNDQALPHHVDPALHEPAVRDARRYLELAERASGPIEPPLSYEQVWGDLLRELQRARPDARIVNLETAVTTSDDWDRQKGIHYRMHPGNVELLRAAGIDVAVLGNNHVLDWGPGGLRETLTVLRDAGVRTAGAGLDLAQAAAPAVLDTPAGQLRVFSYGTPSAGVPERWRATPERRGVNPLPNLSDAEADRVIARVRAHRAQGDRVVVSLHWGANWGYDVPAAQRRFAHRLIDAGGADVVHGHSSHHPKGIEVYRGRLVLYGAGDFLNDYEGIGGHEAYRPQLTAAYLPVLSADGALASMTLAPMRIRRLRLARASPEDAGWLADRLTREGRPFGTRVLQVDEGRLRLDWD